jgi:hypothetical protein
MSYTIDFREDLATIVTDLSDDFDVYQELPEFCHKIYDILEQSPHPLRYISKTDAQVTSVDDIVAAINMLVRGDYPVASHENFMELILVTGNRLAELAVKGMDSEAFGNVHVEVFATMQDAIDHVHSHLG